MQRVFIGLAAGCDVLRAVVDEHLLEGAHGVGGVLAIVAIGGAEEIAQFDEAALGAAHVAVAVALFEGIVGVGDLVAEEQGLGWRRRPRHRRASCSRARGRRSETSVTASTVLGP